MATTVARAALLLRLSQRLLSLPCGMKAIRIGLPSDMMALISLVDTEGDSGGAESTRALVLMQRGLAIDAAPRPHDVSAGLSRAAWPLRGIQPAVVPTAVIGLQHWRD